MSETDTYAFSSPENQQPADALRRSVFVVPKMDCAAEQQLVQLALEGVPQIRRLSFDLAARTLRAWHLGEPSILLARLAPLKLGARLLESAAADASGAVPLPEPAAEAQTLWAVLAINSIMFGVELVAGWLAQSTGLLADSLDMLADAMVYGLALLAVGRPPALKLRAARLNGWLQVALGLGAFVEVGRRSVVGSEPGPPAMIGISLLALAANVSSLLLVMRHRQAGVHMKASVICSQNDVLANAGVIVAGALVGWTGSRLPDLAIGGLIAAAVLAGALRILRLR